MLDQAAIIPDASEKALEDRLRQYFSQTCRAVIVATVSSLKGESVDDYAMNLANRWKIGDPVRGDGVLLLVAPTERQVRIEVIISLQLAMPDAAAAAIIDDGMMTNYAAGDFAAGISQGVEGIVQRLDRYAPQNPQCRSGQDAKL